MAYDSYMQVSNGIEGESTAKGYEKWIKLYSYSFSASNPSTVSSGSTGLSSGRTSVSSFSCTMRREKATPQLFGFMVSGQHIDKIVVHLTKNVGAKGAVQTPFEVAKVTTPILLIMWVILLLSLLMKATIPYIAQLATILATTSKI